MKKWKTYILSFIWGPLLLTQYLLVFVFQIFNKAGNDIVLYLGWIIWAHSFVFGWLPIYVLKKKGGVVKRKSYVNTSILVKSGIYSVIRHPQYTAGILFSLALILISQNLLILVMGLVVIPLLYWDIVMADEHEINKFGDEYKQYMKEVPRTNFLLGIIRLLRKQKTTCNY